MENKHGKYDNMYSWTLDNLKNVTVAIRYLPKFSNDKACIEILTKYKEICQVSTHLTSVILYKSKFSGQ